MFPLPYPRGIFQLLVQAVGDSRVDKEEGQGLPNKPDPTRVGAHVVREDGQLPTFQHVLQLFVGSSSAGCVGKGPPA